MASQKISFPDHPLNGLKNENAINESDTFMLDLNSFSNGLDKDSITNSTSKINSRITLQRSLSRKGPQRGGMESKINDKDHLPPSSSSTASQVVSMMEKTIVPPTQTTESSDVPRNNQLQQHQITIKTGGVSTIAADGRWGNRSSFKRYPPSWFFDPKRILLFCATLSSMGTILLIYFTRSMRSPHEKDENLDWQQ